MDWTVLGIEPTTDKKTITLAYRTKLKQTNPEDKPEEFKALREAYEQATQWADQQNTQAEEAEEDAGPKNPVEQWAASLIALYNDFPRRIKTEAWQELLSQDVVFALDTRPQIETLLLGFLLQKNNLPQQVWQLLNSTFDWPARRSELQESYPQGFIDHLLIDSARYGHVLPMELFTPGLNGDDADAYLELFLRAQNCEWSETFPLIAQMEALSESHPYGLALSYRAMAATGDGLGVVKLLELSAAYPDDCRIKAELADAYLEGESWEQCQKLVDELRATDRKDRRFIWMQAQCLAGLGRYSEAVELLGDLMHAAGGDQKELMELSDVRKQWNASLITQYEERVEQGECDDKLLFELSWCYLQNDQNEKSVELIDRMDKANLEPYEYYNLSSQAFLSTERYEEAFEDSKALVEVVRAMQPDGTEKTEKRLARFAEFIARCGDALYAQKRIEDALPYYEEAAQVAPDNPERLTHYSRVMASLNRWPEAAEAAEQLIKILPGAYHGHYLLAQYYFEMHNDRDAFSEVNQAMRLERGDLGVYVLRLRILMRNGALQEAVNDLRFLEDSQCGEYLPMLWMKALYAEATDLEDEEVDEGCLPELGELADGTPFQLASGKQAALQLYQQIYDHIQQGEEMDFAGEVCFRLALLSQEDGPGSDEKQLEILNKGLELDPHHTGSLDFKAWLLKRMNRTEESIETYLKLVALPHEGVDAERALGQLYAKDSKRQAHKALEFYLKVLEVEPDDPVSLYYAGLYAYYMGNYVLAENLFMREKAIEPDCTDSYRLLSFVYEAWDRLERALEEAETLIEVAKKADQVKLSNYNRKIHILRRMGRWEDAVETCFQACLVTRYEDVHSDVSAIYRQFNRLVEDERHLDAWAAANARHPSDPQAPGDLAFSRVAHSLFAGDMRHAKHFARGGRAAMSVERRFEVDRLLAVFCDDLKAEEKTLEEEMQWRLANDRDTIQVLGQLAAVKWRRGDLEGAAEYATQALALIDEELLPYTTTRPLYLCKRASALALLGRMEEAQEALAEARALPLCEQCVYCRCKDADFFEAEIDLISGNMQACAEKTAAGLEQWPDEDGFIALANALKRCGAM